MNGPYFNHGSKSVIQIIRLQLTIFYSKQINRKPLILFYATLISQSRDKKEYIMNIWTERSMNLANQKNYLDLLFKVYPLSINERRELKDDQWNKVKYAFDHKNKIDMIKHLCDLEIFPIKDSYVAYLKRDRSAIERNPNTVDRISGILFEMGLNDIYENCTMPKETNRQIGPLFKNWIDNDSLGAKVYKSTVEFALSEGNAILNVSDLEMKQFAKEQFGYKRNKGLDFIARFNNTYVLGEAKFLSDFGGHQTDQFEDAIATIHSTLVGGLCKNAKVLKIAILDGVLYINSRNKMHMYLKEHEDEIILSSLLLREFLYSL